MKNKLEVSTDGDFGTPIMFVDLEKNINSEKYWYIFLLLVSNNLFIKTNRAEFETIERTDGYSWCGAGTDIIPLQNLKKVERERLRLEIDKKIITILKGKTFKYKNGSLGRADYDTVMVNSVKDIEKIGIKYLHSIELVN